MKLIVNPRRLGSYCLALGLLGTATFIIWKNDDKEGETRTFQNLAQKQNSSEQKPFLTRRSSDTTQETKISSPADSVVSEETAANSPSLPRFNTTSRRDRPTLTNPIDLSPDRATTLLSLSQLLSNADLSLRDRVRGIESLRSNGSLSEEERELALNTLSSGNPLPSVSSDSWRWLVDELISTLRADGADNAALSQSLANLANDTSHDMIVRDYAIQHLGHLQSEGGDLAVIQQTLQTATQEKEGTIAGTAILALNQDSEIYIGEQAYQIAQDTNYDLRSRITALQVAGKQNHQEALPLAVQIAADSAEPMSLRLSAIATIGDLGASEQTALLETFSPTRDPLLHRAATAALTKLSQ